MKKTLLISFLLLSSSTAFAQSAAVKTQSNQQLSASVADIQASIKTLQKDFKRVSQLLDNKAMLDLFQRLDDVSQDVDELRGLVEEQGHLQRGLQKRQRELYLDLDRRLREMELKATAQPQPKTVTDPINVPEIRPVVPNASATTQVTTPVNTVNSESGKVATINNDPVENVNKPSVTPPQPMSEERKDYQKAFDFLKEGRYNKAKTAFKTFLKKYPDSSYAGNAQYWSGEANYVTRQFATAMEEFKRVITQYPSSNKVPDAMLKLGYTFYETRQMDNAKQILNELVKRFPKSTAARLAAKRIKRMDKEGL